MIHYVDGDILSGLDGTHDIFICQQVNCKGVMGAGLAKQIRAKWPVVFTKYKHACDECTPMELFANYQVVNVGEKTYVANIFGQLNYGTDKRHTSYYAISTVFYNMFVNCLETGNHNAIFRIPYGFGCGLGGGDWGVVRSIIEDAANQYNVNVEIWRKT